MRRPRELKENASYHVIARANRKEMILNIVYIARNPVRAAIVPHAMDYEYNGVSFIHKGTLGILDRPPTAILRRVWPMICRY